MEFKRFSYRSLEDVRQAVTDMSLNLPLSDSTDFLFKPLELWGHIAQNRIVVQPMEGCDASADGSPQELTYRRYRRFAAGGASVIWMEAVSTLPEARANPRQLMLTKQNVDAFKSFLDDIRETALRETGHVPLIVMQATHSGRYSKPDGKSGARILYHSPIYEAAVPLPDSAILSDDELKRIEAQFEVAGKLSMEAGFDAVDIKACHRYLLSESFSAYTRKGPYGGESFENRTRLFFNSIEAALSSGATVTSRLNLYDGPAYPYGWGVAPNGSEEPDMTEPIKLIGILHNKYNLSALNVTIGNPYFNPHVNRPYDHGGYIPPEHPLQGLERVCNCTRQIKEKFPNLTIISSANSYLRQFSPNLGAGMLEVGGADMIGYGRMSFAYPNFPRDLQDKGILLPQKCCVACGKCTELMRMGCVAGCVIRDQDPYARIYREGKEH